jgi:apolipoprotein N-acyltransferase
MIRIPAPYLRGLAVLTLGASFVLGHAALAAPQSSPAKPGVRVQVAQAVSQDSIADLPEGEATELAENCYLEVQKDRTPQGKVVSRIVHECD